MWNNKTSIEAHSDNLMEASNAQGVKVLDLVKGNDLWHKCDDTWRGWKVISRKEATNYRAFVWVVFFWVHISTPLSLIVADRLQNERTCDWLYHWTSYVMNMKCPKKRGIKFITVIDFPYVKYDETLSKYMTCKSSYI